MYLTSLGDRQTRWEKASWDFGRAKKKWPGRTHVPTWVVRSRKFRQRIIRHVEQFLIIVSHATVRARCACFDLLVVVTPSAHVFSSTLMKSYQPVLLSCHETPRQRTGVVLHGQRGGPEHWVPGWADKAP